MNTLLNPPILYYLLASIAGSSGLALFMILRRTGNRIIVEVINPTQNYEVKKLKIIDGKKIKYGTKVIPLPPQVIFSRMGKKIKVYVNGSNFKPIGFKSFNGKESSELANTWTIKEVRKYIIKLIAMSKAQAKIIDTTPLIIILVLLCVNVFMLVMIMRRMGIF